LHTLRRNHATPTDLTTALAHAHTTGTTPTWTTQPTTHHTPLPTYPFQHHRYWLESSTSVAPAPAPALQPADDAPPPARDRFSALSGDDLLDELLSLVREHAAVALGYDSPAPVVSDRTFQELGFESLTAVDLRRRLVAATGLELPVSVAYDHPTPLLLAAHLAELLAERAELTHASDDELFALIDADGSQEMR
ncbi:acyl carrier protein, partial [Streptomyces sp. NPDC006654]|uniref:acyl carrier protein n=1 Tax=Streptomyces sp. NPDC006654 TaxID=3156897 RepID=UPI0033D98A48